ncbi:MAG TPA: SRPBCC family protein [Kofleriaceae bacterium]|nr:SRPBCC family protein [Kofleriaceae bacterium]
MIEGQGVLDQVDGRYRLRFERRLAHPIERVWQMVTDPDGLARWFPARVSYEALAVGAALRFEFEAPQLEQARAAGMEDLPPLVTGGVIREVDPPRVLAFEWDGEPIRVELEPDGEGCRLVFTHIFDRDEAQAPRNATGWHICLEGLEAALAGRAAPGDERQAELLPQYQAAPR